MPAFLSFIWGIHDLPGISQDYCRMWHLTWTVTHKKKMLRTYKFKSEWFYAVGHLLCCTLDETHQCKIWGAFVWHIRRNRRARAEWEEMFAVWDETRQSGRHLVLIHLMNKDGPTCLHNYRAIHPFHYGTAQTYTWTHMRPINAHAVWVQENFPHGCKR